MEQYTEYHFSCHVRVDFPLLDNVTGVVKAAVGQVPKWGQDPGDMVFRLELLLLSSCLIQQG